MFLVMAHRTVVLSQMLALRFDAVHIVVAHGKGVGRRLAVGSCISTYTALMYSFPNLELICRSMSSSNCCFLTCRQISQEAGEVVLYSHLLKNFPQFVVIHTVKGFGVVNKAKIGVFLELSCFFDDTANIGNLISGSSAFSKTSLNIWKFTVEA